MLPYSMSQCLMSAVFRHKCNYAARPPAARAETPRQKTHKKCTMLYLVLPFVDFKATGMWDWDCLHSCVHSQLQFPLNGIPVSLVRGVRSSLLTCSMSPMEVPFLCNRDFFQKPDLAGLICVSGHWRGTQSLAYLTDVEDWQRAEQCLGKG